MPPVEVQTHATLIAEFPAIEVNQVFQVPIWQTLPLQLLTALVAEA